MAGESVNDNGQTGSALAHSELRERHVAQDTRLAAQRVAAYLRAHGLCDEARLDALVGELLQACAGQPDTTTACVALAQSRVERFLTELFPGLPGPVHPLWLRAFAGAHPGCFLGDVEAARALAADFGDPCSGRLPVARPFARQALPPVRVPRWLAGLLPSLAISVGLAGVLLRDLTRGGLTLLELTWGLLFACVLFGPATALSTALQGLRWRSRPDPTARCQASVASLPRCALLVPICHEDPELVFAGVAAMGEALADTPGGMCFDIFVLSDSHDPLCVADEERAFRRVAALAHERSTAAVYYRRRPSNERRKPGNLAEFFERFGTAYGYAVVLDADSLMTGEALVELARRIHADPRLALLQAPLQLYGGRSAWALAQQLTTSVCGPLFTRGLARWSGTHGNYYGHNAIVRVEAFMQCCALPSLPGRPPLGGHFLSHDFVEAALLVGAGWKVRTAWDLQGSWERMPQTFAAYVARERRWCQGNLQHLRMVVAEGLRPMSRLHLLLGALAYLNAALLLAFIGLGLGLAALGGGATVSSPVALGLLCAAALCLGLPRCLGLAETLGDAVRRRQHGGPGRLLASAVLEGALSLLVAPVLLFHHARAVLSVAAGRSVEWGRYPGGRGATSRRATVWVELPTMLCGAGIAALAWSVDTRLALWLSLQWLPMLLAAPVSMACSSVNLARFATRLGLFMTGVDREPPRVLSRAQQLRCVTAPDESARFRDIVLDPVLLATHIERLASPRRAPEAGLERARSRALRLGPAGLTREERSVLLGDATSLRELHRDAWRAWPLETWNLARRLPHTPEP
jgi:membrane glycosyltransferase